MKILKFLEQKGHVKLGNYEYYDYLSFEADIQQLNVLQTIQQGWSNVNCLMSYDQIMESIYYTTVHQNEGSVFQPMPLFFVCGKDLYEQSLKLKNKLRVKVIEKSTKR